MTAILPVLEQLENTNSQKEKIKILETLNEVQQLWFKMCYNPRITFGIKKIPDIPENTNKDLETSQVMDLYNNLFVTRKLTGNAAIEKLSEILSRAKELEPAIRLIQRDAKCGVNSALLNKVFPKLIPEIPCMLAQPMNEKTLKNIKFPAISQLKADGMRCIAFVDLENENVEFFSRNGSPLDLQEIRESILHAKDFKFKKFVLDGELIGYTENGMMDRKTSNGICNKLIRNTITDSERQKLVYEMWDIVENTDGSDKTPYYERFDNLIELVILADGRIARIPSKVVNSMEEAMEDFQEKLDSGLEGTILKNRDSVYEDKRSSQLIKLKEEKTVDLEVIAIDEGDGDFEGGIGALTCVTSDKKLVVSVGTGLSLEDRGFTNDLSEGKKVVKQIKTFKEASKKFLGKIVEVKYNQIIKAKDKNEYSLFLPRLVQIRLDKDQANSIDEI